jgi:hypothetical protein
MWQLKNSCLTTDNMLEMPIHNVIICDQFKPILIFISKIEHYTLLEPLIVIYELNVLLAYKRFILGIRILFFQSKKAGTRGDKI